MAQVKYNYSVNNHLTLSEHEEVNLLEYYISNTETVKKGAIPNTPLFIDTFEYSAVFDSNFTNIDNNTLLCLFSYGQTPKQLCFYIYASKNYKNEFDLKITTASLSDSPLVIHRFMKAGDQSQLTFKIKAIYGSDKLFKAELYKLEEDKETFTLLDTYTHTEQSIWYGGIVTIKPSILGGYTSIGDTPAGFKFRQFTIKNDNEDEIIFNLNKTLSDSTNTYILDTYFTYTLDRGF